MSTTAPDATVQQERWQKITNDPLLSELPYKVEINQRGQIVLSPHTNRHTFQQKAVLKKLDELLSGGEAFQELAIATSGGTKQADVVWASDDRLAEMKQTGDPTTLAPEICIEVMSDINTMDEMHEKHDLYQEAGADEVWIVDPNGEVRFFGEEEKEHSDLVPDFPNRV